MTHDAQDRSGTASPDQDPGERSVPAPGSTIVVENRLSLGLELLAHALSWRSQSSLDARPSAMTKLVTAEGKPCTWPAIRRHVLRRDDYTCRVCGDEADEIDHIFPRRRGGSDFLENLRAICGLCNKVKGTYADLQAATMSDLGGGMDIAFDRIAGELDSNVFPVLREMADRAIYEDGQPDAEHVRAILDHVAERFVQVAEHARVVIEVERSRLAL